MSIVIALWALLLPSDPDRVEALRASAPRYLTTETAREHLTAAQAAAVQYNLDHELLLAIAYRESRYTVNMIGPVVRGKRACGVMQPLMWKTCRSQSLFSGYMEGAKHLRTWLDTKACRGDMNCAMLGYSGGYSLLKGCAIGKVLVERSGRMVNLCSIPAITFARARRIAPQRPGV